MIGNDVVDLGHRSVQPGACHLRFDERVFSSQESERLRASEAPDRLRWVYWACKEAAYKVHKKLDPQVIWSPRRFLVNLDADLQGCVQHAGRSFHVWVEQGAEYVHALASTDPRSVHHLRWKVGSISSGEDESQSVRMLAMTGLSEELGMPLQSLSIERHERIPHLCADGKYVAGLDLSLSHHGRFVAWAASLARLRDEIGDAA